MRLWLHGKSVNTRDAYARDLQLLLSFATSDDHPVALQQIRLQTIGGVESLYAILTLRHQFNTRMIFQFSLKFLP